MAPAEKIALAGWAAMVAPPAQSAPEAGAR
jgi:hypothetical protein